MPRNKQVDKITDTDIENAFPAYPEFIRIVENKIFVTKSDGDSQKLPEEEEEECSSDGTVDYLTNAHKKDYEHWLSRLGDYIMNIDKHLAETYPSRTKHFKLEKFPEGYKLFVHKKGAKSNPRRDLYLHGSSTERCTRFRSPEEFALHLLWLAHGMPRDKKGRSRCLCFYCSRTKITRAAITEYLKKKTHRLKKPTGSSSRSNWDPKVNEPSKIMMKDYTGLNKGQGVKMENTMV